MTPERYERVCQICYDALELEPNQRASFLDQVCEGDESLRQQVEAMLVNEGRVNSFLREHALDVAAKLLAGEHYHSRPEATRSGSTVTTQPDRDQQEFGSPTRDPIFIDNYRVLRKLGEGGMGVVYEAEQQRPRRHVALKMIRGGRLVSEYQIELFQREAQALARLKHPGIATIYEVGRTDDDRHYFVMELVRGISLLDYVKGQRLAGTQAPCSIKQRLELFLKVCDAISYAHQRGVIHRDLKPANILVTDESEITGGASLSRVEIKILDFGLARLSDEEVTGASGLSQPGQLKGTLSYMSPEQARGDTDQIDVRTDVYALGVILYELLAEQRPYELEHATLLQAIHIICETYPKQPNQVRSKSPDRDSRKAERIDRDLETIVFKALEKEPERRYRSVATLADDVTRYLTNHPIQARMPSTFYQFRKLVTRHKIPFASLAVLLLLILGFAITMALQSARIARERDKADEQRIRAEEQELSNRRLLYVAHINLSQRYLERWNIQRMHELLENHLPKPGQEDLRGFEWYYLWRICHNQQITLRNAELIGNVKSFLDNNIATTEKGKSIPTLLEATTGLVTIKAHRHPVSHVLFSIDDKIMTTVDGGNLKLWRLIAEQEPTLIRSGRIISWGRQVAFSSDGKTLAAQVPDCALKFTNLYWQNEKVWSDIRKNPDCVREFNGALRIWDVVTGQEITTLKAPPANQGQLILITFSDDGKTVVTASNKGLVNIFDLATGQEIGAFKIQEGVTDSLEFSPDGTKIAALGSDGNLNLLDLGSGKQMIRHEDTKTGNQDIRSIHRTLSRKILAFSPDGKILAQGSYDGSVILLDTFSGRELTTLKGHERRVNVVAFSPDGKRLATGSSDCTTKLWDILTGHELITLSAGALGINCLAFSPDGKTLASGSDDGIVRLWIAATEKEVPDRNKL